MSIDFSHSAIIHTVRSDPTFLHRQQYCERGEGWRGQDLADRGSHTEDGLLGCRWVELVTALK